MRGDLALECLTHGSCSAEAVEVYVLGDVIHGRLHPANIIRRVLEVYMVEGVGVRMSSAARSQKVMAEGFRVSVGARCTPDSLYLNPKP